MAVCGGLLSANALSAISGNSLSWTVPVHGGLSSIAPLTTVRLDAIAAHPCGWEIVAYGVDMRTLHYGGLEREAETAGGRLMTLTIHPWMSGQPHRIKALETALAHIMRHDGVWSATGADILAAFKAGG